MGSVIVLAAQALHAYRAPAAGLMRLSNCVAASLSLGTQGARDIVGSSTESFKSLYL
jgi:hypothetical protein